MPYTWFTFERLGVLDWFAEAACPKKYSVQFVSTTGKVSQPFYFFETIEHPCSTTWQVRRSDFDRMLLDNARSKGADVRQGTTVRELLTDGGRAVGVRAETGGGRSETIRADAVIDASGRDTFLASKLGWKPARPRPDEDRHLLLLPRCEARPRTRRRGDDGRLHPREGVVLVHPAARRRRQRRRSRRGGLPVPRHARPGSDLLARGGRVHLGCGPPARRHAGGAGPRDRRVQLPRRGDRRRRLLPGRRRILVPRPGLLDRRLHGPQERRDGGGRGAPRSRCRWGDRGELRRLRARHAVGARSVPAARAVVLQPDLQLPGLHPGSPRPPPAAGRRPSSATSSRTWDRCSMRSGTSRPARLR